jgi:RHS repeat-associated protein
MGSTATSRWAGVSWVRTRRESDLCAATCVSSITRFVWAGDQLLWELKAPGTEYDNLEATTGAGERFGRVSYTHGGGIDRPLALHKEGQGSLVPHDNWRGQFASGTCIAVNGVGCGTVAWPGWQTNAYHAMTAPPTSENWRGSLVDGMRDATGQMYRRNRYYDPGTGQFTQPDPIGIAGGLNVYGFANGDPVTYADPYGLKVECASQEACDLWNDLGRRVNAGLRSDDERVRKGAETLRDIKNAVYFDPDVTYVIEVSDIDDAHGGGRELDRPEGGYLIQIDSEPPRDVSFTKPVVLAHELGGALRRQRGGVHWRGGPWGENAARRIAGCKLRWFEGGIFPDCHW